MTEHSVEAMSLGTSPTLSAAIQDHLEVSVSLVQVAVTQCVAQLCLLNLLAADWGNGTFIMS